MMKMEKTGREVLNMRKYILMLFLLIKAMVFSELILDINDTKLINGETAVLSVIVKDQKLSDFKVKGIENFKILSQGQSSSTQIINGKKSSSKTYQYRILPLSEGKFNLKAVGNYKKDNFESNELEIEVAQNFGKSEIRSDFFIKSTTLKDKYYFGEKIILSEHLITTVNIQNFGFVDEPKYSEFTEKNITEKGYEGKYTRIDGKKAIDYTVYKAILEPLRSGEFVIPGNTFQINTTDTNSFFSDIKPNYLQTKEKRIKILELPEEGKPADFSGAVGLIKSEYKFDKTEAEFGEAINLTVKLRGNANLDTLEKIITTNIPGVKIYQNVKNTKEFVVDDKYTVEKEYEIVFIPQKSGEIKIPEIKVPYFNTSTEQYDEVKIPEQILKISGAAIQNKGAEDKQNLEKQEIEISQISEAETAPEKPDYFTAMIILAITNIITLTALFFFYFKNKKQKIEITDLKQVKTAIKKSKDIQELYTAYNEAVKLKYNISIKSYSTEQIIRELGDQDGNEIADIIKELETLKYFNKAPQNELKEKIIKTL